MSLVKIWIHTVWSTKNRKPLLKMDFRQQIYDHILENANKKDILIDCVGGYLDHIHILLRLRNDQTVSKVLQLIKGESSHWVNNQDFLKEKFEWQKEYFAVSIGEEDVNRVRGYIQNQYRRHKPKSYQDIYQEFINKYGFEIKG